LKKNQTYYRNHIMAERKEEEPDLIETKKIQRREKKSGSGGKGAKHDGKKCVVIFPDGKTVVVPHKLEAMQKAVGGNIETIPAKRRKGAKEDDLFFNEHIPYDVYCNEEGFCAQLPQNATAAFVIDALGFSSSSPYHLVYGPVVISETELRKCRPLSETEIAAIEQCCAALRKCDDEESMSVTLRAMVKTIVDDRKPEKRKAVDESCCCAKTKKQRV
jgi:hypothetical protein